MTVKGTSHTTHSSGTEHHSTGESHNSGDTTTKQGGVHGDTSKTQKNADGSDVQRDSHGNIDNDKNAKKDSDGKYTGEGIDVNAPPPKDPNALQAYNDKKALVEQGKAAGMQADQLLQSTLAQIKQWAKDHESDDGSI